TSKTVISTGSLYRLAAASSRLPPSTAPRLLPWSLMASPTWPSTPSSAWSSRLARTGSTTIPGAAASQWRVVATGVASPGATPATAPAPASAAAAAWPATALKPAVVVSLRAVNASNGFATHTTTATSRQITAVSATTVAAGTDLRARRVVARRGTPRLAYGRRERMRGRQYSAAHAG